MLPEREWAKDMSQAEFNVQFPRKYSNMSVIPDVTNWVNYMPKGMKIAPKSEEEEGIEVPPVKKWECQFCGRSCTSQIGNISHERKCPEGLNKKLIVRNPEANGETNISRLNK